MNEITFFRASHVLERSLSDVLHPLALGEELVTNTLDVWVLDDDGSEYVAVPTHRSKANAVFIKNRGGYPDP